jgi:hypothetical protein
MEHGHSELNFRHLALDEIPVSGTNEEVLDHHSLGVSAIRKALEMALSA